MRAKDKMNTYPRTGENVSKTLSNVIHTNTGTQKSKSITMASTKVKSQWLILSCLMIPCFISPCFMLFIEHLAEGT